jgi:preprotein translocase subunit SecF
MQVPQFNIDFMGKGKIGLVLSALLVLGSFIAFFVRGLEYGIDFTGGTVVEVAYAEPADLNEVRDVLQQGGYDGAQVQHFGTARDVLIRLPPTEGMANAQLSDNIVQTLRAAGHDVSIQRIEFVGPQVGEELAVQGLQAVIWVMLGIMIYIWFRFSGWQLAVNSVVAVVHDVIVTVGFFAVLGLEFDLTVLAAVLAVAGYSLNDNVVVFDRIRENFLRMRKASPKEVINTSVNQTLSRTIITSGTTLAVVITLYLFGGDVLRNFSLALIVGVIAGTYSTVFVASNLALMMGVDKNVFIVPEKEGAEADAP